MELHRLVPIIFLLCLLTPRGSDANSTPAEAYWQSMLPNSSLPKALKELLLPGNRSTFTDMENAPNSAFRATYGVGYWAENKNFDKSAMLYSTTIYFLHDDLHPKKEMMLIFTKSMNGSIFLPRKIVESIPFSSNKFPDILSYFSVKPTSKQAQIMKQTVEECEAPAIRGENKYCATSLESIVDFVVAKFGNQVLALSNEAEEEYKKKKYTILEGIKLMGDDQIVCHKQRYVYAVFYCHMIMATKVYVVPLVGDDGTKAKAIVICHTDTSSWSPEHFAFQVLKVKPGGPAVCHFLNSDTIVWVPK